MFALLRALAGCCELLYSVAFRVDVVLRYCVAASWGCVLVLSGLCWFSALRAVLCRMLCHVLCSGVLCCAALLVLKCDYWLLVLMHGVLLRARLCSVLRFARAMMPRAFLSCRSSLHYVVSYGCVAPGCARLVLSVLCVIRPRRDSTWYFSVLVIDFVPTGCFFALFA